ncbi:hypothetical protein CXB51_020436 [Gossypium anomalum]|uniref:Uncharacterized protein n=1 Tax=Gossypium anomalum TaxID=47600 RepID=A0A8J6CWB1_9ROSI|nr:hypothetical protein CXB51_020436 [Gossypium anomalum]
MKIILSDFSSRCIWLQILDMFNVATTFCKRVSVKELVTSAPVYTTIAANFMELLFFICGFDGPSSGLSLMLRRWASKNPAGSTKNGRDSKPKNLGFVNEEHDSIPDTMSGLEKDHSLYALKEGCVKFETHKFSGRKWVHVEPKKCPLSSLCYCCFRRAEDSHIRFAPLLFV